MNPTAKRFSFKAMGSFCEIQLFEESHFDTQELVQLLTKEVARLEKKYSRFRETSFLTDINLSAGTSCGIEIDGDQMRADIEAYDAQIDRGKKYFTDDQLRRIMSFRLYRGGGFWYIGNYD